MPDQPAAKKGEAGHQPAPPRGSTSPPRSIAGEAETFYVCDGTPFIGAAGLPTPDRQHATQALLALELELHALELVEPRGEDFAYTLWLVRERLELHHLAPHRAVLEEWDVAA
ncbi:MAG: hypothetical protein ACRDL2_10760 [Gaiellaceae bacterium]